MTVLTVKGRSRIFVATRVPVIDSAETYSLVALVETLNSGSAIVSVSDKSALGAGGVWAESMAVKTRPIPPSR